ncbi:MAG: LysR family transcriptional regulator [Lachnospiraceae bacterium]|nr:LysR family transcriptional regulator [Lachnospiraceae bacterium]
MNIEYEYIYEVYKTGSISRAAENLYITQPALSMSIRRIENSIGMALFDRSRHPLVLTEAGELYIHKIREIKQLEETLASQINDLNQLKTGSIKIGGSNYVNSRILPDIVTAFNRKYPGINISLTEHSSAVLARMLKDRELDITFNCDEKLILGFERYPAFYDHVLLAVPFSYPLPEHVRKYALNAADVLQNRHLSDDCPILDPSEFSNLDYIILTEGNNLRNRSLSFFHFAGFDPHIKLSVSQLSTAYALAKSGFGASLISDRMVTQDSTHLSYYRITPAISQRLFYMILPNREYTSNIVKEFIHFFQQYSKIQEYI